MLPSRYRLHSRAEISRTIRQGRRARRGSLVVHVQVGDDSAEPARAAFAVSKAVGDSVTRHRVVRRLRGLMPPLLDRMPGGSDVVVRAMPEAATASSAQLREDLERALERVTPLAPPTATNARECAVAYTESTEITHAGAHSAVGESARVDQPPRTGVHLVLYWIGWPIRSLLLGLIWVYRHTISPMLPPTCRYYPSCSAYGFEALQVHGALKGTALTAWRVLRCNPFTGGGLDPVPQRGEWRPDIHPDGTPRVAGHSHA
jgi:putative membrane protein insertion efficiency factor/ribonuclease P protein component